MQKRQNLLLLGMFEPVLTYLVKQLPDLIPHIVEQGRRAARQNGSNPLKATSPYPRMNARHISWNYGWNDEAQKTWLTEKV